MKDYHQKILKTLFQKFTDSKAENITPLPPSGSQRKYYRITIKETSVIGAYNPDKKENQAFIYLTKHFRKNKLNVPELLLSDINSNIYLLEDLGDKTVFSMIENIRKKKSSSKELIQIYKRIIDELPKFQIIGAKNLDFSKCYPRPSFDKQSILWDLNYFKYSYLKPAGISFDEQRLEDDFHTLTDYLLQADSKYFMYRDFNTRNIMVKDEELFFIDYQGGRKGALQYDIASLLFSSKANIPMQMREELLAYYLESVNKLKKIDRKDFNKFYYEFVLIRILQMLGAYGFRGYFESKSHFLQSIPFAINNLEWLLKQNKIKIRSKIKELVKTIELCIESDLIKNFTSYTNSKKLTVTINSFSYRNKIPTDYSGNGGGFVFDCRAIPNPGRIDELKIFTGRDLPVQKFLDSKPDAKLFLRETFKIVEQSVQKYIRNNYTHLMVNFGCTGGQHRSVYCAEKLAKHLKGKFNINVRLTHTEQGKRW